MKLLVGLGNPGAEYRDTRHNLGFWVIDRLRERLPEGRESRISRSPLVETRWRREPLALLKPMQFMNCSGAATAQALRQLQIAAKEVLVVYDDLDLTPGRIRLKRGGSSGGHRGVADIMEQIGGGFHRLRLGIGRPSRVGGRAVEDYVLEPFSAEDQEQVASACDRAADAALMWVARGMAAAMDRFNGESPTEEPDSGASERDRKE